MFPQKIQRPNYRQQVLPPQHSFRTRSKYGHHPVLQNIRKDRDEDSIIYTELTDRELDVLKLIANGYSNSQIAGELVISENTVKGHVSNILSKLHLADRTQAAVYAWQQGIVKREPLD